VSSVLDEIHKHYLCVSTRPMSIIYVSVC